MRERQSGKAYFGWATAAFLAGFVGYLLLFYTAVPERLQIWHAVFIPDWVVMSWVGGDFGRFSVLDRVPVLLVAGSIVAIAFVFGRLTLSFVRCDRQLFRLEIVVFSIGVGLSELSLLTLAIGLLGGLRCLWCFVLPIGLVVALAAWQWKRGAFQQPNDNATGIGDAATTDADWLGRWGLWLGVPFVLLILFGGMLPPWDFDVREYHLQVPKEWYQEGKIGFLPHNIYGNMPLGAEMHALLAMVIMPGERDWWWGALAGKTVIAAFVPLTALALFAAGRRFVSTTAGVFAALVYMSTPWVVHVSVQGLNEGAVAFYLLLAVYAMLLSSPPVGPGCRTGPDAADSGGKRSSVSRSRPADGTYRETTRVMRGRILLAGFLAGSAVACKYPAVLFVVLPLLAWSMFCERRFDWKRAILFLLAVFVACGLWFGKNWALAGNPVYPLMFGGKTRTAEKTEQWNRAHQVPRDEDGRRYSAAQAADAFRQFGWRSHWLSPLLIPLAVMAFVSTRCRRLAWMMAALVLYFVLAWWLVTHRIDRFWVPVLPIVALLAGVGAVWSNDRLWRSIAGTILVCGLLANLLFLVSTNRHDHRHLVSLEQLRRDEPADEHGASRVNAFHRYLNEAVPKGHTVLLVGDAQPFDLEMPVIYSTCFDDCVFEQLMKGRTREERLAALREHRISHIYVSWAEIERYRSPGNYGFTNYVTKSVVRDELARDQGLLRRVPLNINPDIGEVFQVVGHTQPK
ncbi:MAG: hypothetical protein H8E44_39220 [Planctomycetes bacterium]|nr:hypothetical protein [Planctomycetota bacterium]MBL7042858.1 hypothetical protein [Pirellulaceae bacterium]